MESTIYGVSHKMAGVAAAGDLYDLVEYKFELKKGGLTGKEFKDSLTSKMDSLMMSAWVSKSQDQRRGSRGRKNVKGDLNLALSYVLKNICITQNNSDQDTLDGRRKKAIENYVAEGVLRKHCESPKKAEEDTKGKQGTVKFSKTTYKTYKRNQTELLKQLVSFFNEDEARDEVSQSDSMTAEFCNTVDLYTLKILSLVIGSERLQPETERKKLRSMYSSCKHVIMGRFVNDMIKENNLVKKNGWISWRNHLYVFISFAAMMTALVLSVS